MQTVRKQAVALYADRISQQWVVRDGDGNFWVLPAGEKAWELRQPFYPTEETELEPIPNHYKYLLGLTEYQPAIQ